MIAYNINCWPERNWRAISLIQVPYMNVIKCEQWQWDLYFLRHVNSSCFSFCTIPIRDDNSKWRTTQHNTQSATSQSLVQCRVAHVIRIRWITSGDWIEWDSQRVRASIGIIVAISWIWLTYSSQSRLNCAREFQLVATFPHSCWVTLKCLRCVFRADYMYLIALNCQLYHIQQYIILCRNLIWEA